MASSVSDLDERNQPSVEEGQKPPEPTAALPNPKHRVLIIGALVVAAAAGAWF